MKKSQSPFTQQNLLALLTFLLEETKRQSPAEFEKRLRNSEFDFSPVPLGVRNTIQWIGSEKSLHSFYNFSQLHRLIIANDEKHFKEHLTSEYLLTEPLIMGGNNNDVFYILKALRRRKLLRIFDTWHGVIFEHFVDKYERAFDRDGRLKSAVNKKPLIMNKERVEFLDSIIDQIAFDDR